MEHPVTSERADAARNRRKILAAAVRIVATEGPGGLSLDEVARQASVGVGTVYRRFGDRAGLVFALLDEYQREFERVLTAGEPPLGPGAPPDVRLRAFLHGLVDLVEEHQELLLLAEASSPPARYVSGPYSVQRAHVNDLLGQLRLGADAGYLADALLAPFTPSLIAYQRRIRGLTVADIKAGLDTLVDRLIRTGS